MKTRVELQQELDRAIDAMDMQKVELLLAQLAGNDPTIPAAEDSRLFAARIKQLEKEREPMKTSRTVKTTLIAAAVVVSLSLGVYAAANMASFTFAEGGHLVRIRTGDSSLTESAAKELASETVEALKNGAPEGGAFAVNEGEEAGAAPQPSGKEPQAKVIRLEETEYTTLAQGEQALGLRMALPEGLDLPFALASGLDMNGNDKMLRAIYGDIAGGKSVQLLLSRRVPSEGTAATTVEEMDEGSLGSYRSAKGYEFTTFSESSPDGSMRAQIALTERGYYQYSVAFVGFSEQEAHQMLDSLDLSIYG